MYTCAEQNLICMRTCPYAPQATRSVRRQYSLHARGGSWPMVAASWHHIAACQGVDMSPATAWHFRRSHALPYRGWTAIPAIHAGPQWSWTLWQDAIVKLLRLCSHMSPKVYVVHPLLRCYSFEVYFSCVANLRVCVCVCHAQVYETNIQDESVCFFVSLA